MNLHTLMSQIYQVILEDEKLLRLLHYVPKNQNDDPLSPDKPNITELPPVEKFKIINEIVYFTDKKLELDLDPNFSRLNFYLGNRKPYKAYSKATGRLGNNPRLARQDVIFDIHTTTNINMIDMRLYSIIDRINNLIYGKDIQTFIPLHADLGYTIYQTPDGFVGYRLTFYTLLPQASCD